MLLERVKALLRRPPVPEGHVRVPIAFKGEVDPLLFRHVVLPDDVLVAIGEIAKSKGYVGKNRIGQVLTEAVRNESKREVKT